MALRRDQAFFYGLVAGLIGTVGLWVVSPFLEGASLVPVAVLWFLLAAIGSPALYVAVVHGVDGVNVRFWVALAVAYVAYQALPSRVGGTLATVVALGVLLVPLVDEAYRGYRDAAGDPDDGKARATTEDGRVVR